MVLEMLAAGKITIEQANQLIDVLGENPLSTEEEWPIKRQRSESREPVQPYREQGILDPRIDHIIEVREHDIKPSYVIKFRQRGLFDLTFDEILELREHDVKPTYITRLRQGGLSDLSVDQVIDLSEHHIKPAY